MDANSRIIVLRADLMQTSVWAESLSGAITRRSTSNHSSVKYISFQTGLLLPVQMLSL